VLVDAKSRGALSLDVLGMRERASSLDGEINIVNQHGSGTLVGVRIPLHRASELKKN
jgi:signal transduction histidine kinase